jgi:geranylgeranyl diphosphate synthase type I
MDLEKFQDKIGEIDTELRDVISGKKDPKEFYEPISYHILGGGKRIRPVLALLACEAISGDYKKALPAAASLELIHAFTLVHDDIMDRDTMRRGKPTVYSEWGEPLAINAGDGIFAKAYESLGRLKTEPEITVKALQELSDAILEVCEGQAIDISFEGREEVSTEEYLEMASKKTAALIESSTKIGAIIGKGTEEQVHALSKYGRDIGLAFQIWDDYIDFASEKTGKTHGSDIKKGKKTFIVCHCLEHAGSDKKTRLLEILNAPIEDTDKVMIAEAVEILNSTGSIGHAKEYAERLVNDAKDSLGALENSEAKNLLEGFADFVVSREH